MGLLWPMRTSACGVLGLWLVPAVQEEEEKSIAFPIQSVRDWKGQGIETRQQLQGPAMPTGTSGGWGTTVLCFANTWQGNGGAREVSGQRQRRGKEVTCPRPLSEAVSEPAWDPSSS